MIPRRDQDEDSPGVHRAAGGRVPQHRRIGRARATRPSSSGSSLSLEDTPVQPERARQPRAADRRRGPRPGPLEEFLPTPPSPKSWSSIATHIYDRARGAHRAHRRALHSTTPCCAIERIVTPLGRRIDESTPMVDARLKDGSRVNAIIPPLALRGPLPDDPKVLSAHARRRRPDRLRLARRAHGDDFLEPRHRAAPTSSSPAAPARARRRCSTSCRRRSPTTSASSRSRTPPSCASIQPHVVSLETRPPNMEGKGEYSIRDLVRNALRMRPDRIVVGECRGGEALDMLQAMNTGHDGSLTTIHANSPAEAHRAPGDARAHGRPRAADARHPRADRRRLRSSSSTSRGSSTARGGSPDHRDRGHGG